MPYESYAIRTSRLITPLQQKCDAIVLVQEGKILAVGDQKTMPVPEGFRILDLGDKILAPGFIDIHNHGGMGLMVWDEGEKAVRVNAKRLVETGCTGWLPTVNNLLGIKGVLATMKQPCEGTETLGIHMEGPFLAPKDVQIKGIDEGLLAPSMEKFMELVKASEGKLKLMGISVELPGSEEIIKEMRKLGIVPACAHSSGATYEQFMHAVDIGIRHVTHAFNVMTGLHHRHPGVAGGALTCDQVTAEIVADGFHVSPTAMDVLVRCKGTDHICIVTDNTAIAGLPDGEYSAKGIRFIKKDGITRFADATFEMDHTMAGSEWSINSNIRNMVEKVNVKFDEAIKMATLIPARVAGVEKEKGSIEVGKDADLVAVDEKVNVYLTLVKGKIYFDRLGVSQA